MSKKKTQSFEEYQKEQEREMLILKQQMEDEKKKEQQIVHQIQKSLNEAKALKKKRSKQRNARLIRKGIAVEAACADSRYLTESEFFELAHRIFADDLLRNEIAAITMGRREVDEETRRDLDERIAMYSSALKEMG